jgi:NADH:ubiquinone oxidoreductase subunit 5 (subunit L)/multisubunit Na+/H+ antiporter MnhA subunit
VHNEWVRFIVRDPESGCFFRHVSDGRFVETTDHHGVAITRSRDRFALQRAHGIELAQREAVVYALAVGGMLTATALPIALYGATAMNPFGALTALAAASLALPVLAFSRRYLHGEFMFSRFCGLSVGLLAAFNLVATAPDLVHALAGWSLFGFASTFLIGSYNDRPTVRNNATFVFAAYRVADFALLTAAAFMPPLATAEMAAEHGGLIAACLLVAAAFKSSQWPLSALFVRSMEGPTPTSALGYAGLSAHVGVVLLASTVPLWYPFEAARLAMVSVAKGDVCLRAVLCVELAA